MTMTHPPVKISKTLAKTKDDLDELRKFILMLEAEMLAEKEKLEALKVKYSGEPIPTMSESKRAQPGTADRYNPVGKYKKSPKRMAEIEEEKRIKALRHEKYKASYVPTGTSTRGKHIRTPEMRANTSKGIKNAYAEGKMDNRKTSMPKVKCPHCDVIGGTNTMSRWHFDKCKMKG